jgi:xanthine dehydrogenase YagR molybdenum-binding subunit
VTGAARYAAEFAAPDMAHAAIVQSTIAKGRIAPIDSAAAERLPGVLAVITHENAPKLPYRQPDAVPVDPLIGRQLPMLQDDLVRHNGQHIAVVVAETFEQATHAADLIRVTYEEATTDLEGALSQAFPISEADEEGGMPRATSGAIRSAPLRRRR